VAPAGGKSVSALLSGLVHKQIPANNKKAAFLRLLFVAPAGIEPTSKV
jgi:hypothetical protein